MVPTSDPGALLARSFTLPRGPRVRLRLARVRDLPAVEALLHAAGQAPRDLDLMRLLRADPRRSLAITATALIDGRETVVGFGALDLRHAEAIPDPLVVHAGHTDGLDTLLSDALLGRAASLRRTRAA